MKKSNETLEKLQQLERLITNVDLQSTKWHKEVMCLFDDIAEAIREHNASIVHIGSVLLEHQKAIIGLYGQKNVENITVFPSLSEKDNKSN